MLDVVERVNNIYYYIRISENALIQLVLNGLEAYSVFHQGKKKAETRLETYGLLWGHETHLSNNNDILYSIELISVDTSAERSRNFCNPNDSALQLKRDIMTSFWPHYDFLGDFHTHPYKKYTDVTKNKCYNYSAGDVKSLEDYSDYWKNYNYRVGLVLTIALLSKEGTKGFEHTQNNLIEFTLGNYRLWIKGYVLYKAENDNGEKITTLKVSDHKADNVILDCTALVGLSWEFTPFGRGEPKRGHIPKI